MIPHSKREEGQASLEYVLIGVLLMAMMGACSALWNFFSEGRASELIRTNASHAMTNLGGFFDALLF